MDFVKRQLSNIDNHHYLSIVPGNKKQENIFEANISKESFMSKLEEFIKFFNIQNEHISTNCYREYINQGYIYNYTEIGVECYVDKTIE